MSATVDEEKMQTVQENPPTDSENEEEDQQILNAAWGKHGKVGMWIGYAAHVQTPRQTSLTMQLELH